jgi:hypothetical protein
VVYFNSNKIMSDLYSQTSLNHIVLQLRHLCMGLFSVPVGHRTVSCAVISDLVTIFHLAIISQF